MTEGNFVDYVKIHCAAGHGGAGSVHLHRSRLTAKGGPDGAERALDNPGASCLG